MLMTTGIVRARANSASNSMISTDVFGSSDDVGEQHCAGRGLDQPIDATNQCAFAGARRSHHRIDAALGKREIDVAQDRLTANVLLREPADNEGIGHGNRADRHHGFSATGAKRLSERCGCDRGSLQHHFFAFAAASAFSRAVSLSYDALSNPCPDPLATCRTTSQVVL